MICKVQNTKRQHIRCSLVTWNSKFNTVMPFKRFFSQGVHFHSCKKKQTEKTLPNRPAKRAHGSTMGNKIWLSTHPRNFGSDKIVCQSVRMLSAIELADVKWHTHYLGDQAGSCQKGIRWLVSHSCFRGLSCRTYWGNVLSADQLSAQVNKKSTVSPAWSWIYVLMLDS